MYKQQLEDEGRDEDEKIAMVKSLLKYISKVVENSSDFKSMTVGTSGLVIIYEHAKYTEFAVSHIASLQDDIKCYQKMLDD